MKNLLLTSLILFVCSGCVSAYQLPSQNVDTANVTLEKVAGESIPSGGVVMMVKVDDDFVCKPGQGVVSQKKMAVLSNHSVVGDFNKDGLRVEAIPNFRFLVRSTAVGVSVTYYTLSLCDVLVDMPTEKGKFYKVQSSFNKTGCDVRIFEENSLEKEVKPTRYQKC